MVAIASTLFSTLFATAGTAAVAAPGLATATAGLTAAGIGTGASLFSASTLGTILSGGASLIGAMAAIRQGQDKADALNIQATDADAKAMLSDADAQNRQDSLRRGLIKTLGEQDVAYAASGIDVSFGTAATARADSERDAANALTTDTENEAAQKLSFSRQAAAYRRAASEARRAGGLTALTSIIGAGADILNRG